MTFHILPRLLSNHVSPLISQNWLPKIKYDFVTLNWDIKGSNTAFVTLCMQLSVHLHAVSCRIPVLATTLQQQWEGDWECTTELSIELKLLPLTCTHVYMKACKHPSVAGIGWSVSCHGSDTIRVAFFSEASWSDAWTLSPLLAQAVLTEHG